MYIVLLAFVPGIRQALSNVQRIENNQALCHLFNNVIYFIYFVRGV